MTTADEAAADDRVARERREADRRYNDALTALDRAIVDAGAQPSLGQHDLVALASTLIVFLQQITAFVESKDREVAADAGARMTRIEQSLTPFSEMRTQLTVVSRAIQALTRSHQSSVVSRPSEHQAPGTAHPAPSTQHPALAQSYVAFEDQFRGDDAAIADKVRAYVPIFAGAANVVDLGCGRGELLAALGAAGITARGVDANGEMAAIARERGLEAIEGDALAFLDAAADASLGGLAAIQVVEHLEPSYLARLLEVASRKLKAGAPIVLETINPACWLAFFSSYVRDLTHVRPVHPETLQFLLRASGFERVEIRYSAPVPAHMKMKTIDLTPEIASATDAHAAALAAVAHTVNANAVILNNLMFTHLDYAAVGYRS